MSDKVTDGKTEKNNTDTKRKVTETPEITWIEKITEAVQAEDSKEEDSKTENSEEKNMQTPYPDQQKEQSEDTDTTETEDTAAELSDTEKTQENITEDKFSQEADERKIKKQENQSTSSSQASSDSVYETYIIKPGDTLYQISISHYGNMDAIPEICRLNNLTENQVIYPGQTIVLP